MRIITTDTYFEEFRDVLKNFTFLKESQLKTIIPFESPVQDIFDTLLSALMHNGVKLDGIINFIVEESHDGLFWYELSLINKNHLPALSAEKGVINKITSKPGIPMEFSSQEDYIYAFMRIPMRSRVNRKCPLTNTLQNYVIKNIILT